MVLRPDGSTGREVESKCCPKIYNTGRRSLAAVGIRIYHGPTDWLCLDANLLRTFELATLKFWRAIARMAKLYADFEEPRCSQRQQLSRALC